MQHRYRTLMVLTAAVIIAAGCRPTTGAENAARPGSRGAAVNTAFPDFQVKTLDDQSVSLARYRGKIVILDLFASWCPPCRMGIPEFVELQKKYADRLAVVGLSYDQGSAQDLKKFLAKMKVNYDVYWGSEEIANYVGLRGIPHTLVLDREGRVFKSYVGYTPAATFEQNILTLSQPAAAPTEATP